MALTDFGDIITSVRQKLGIQPTDALATTKIKAIINEVYLDEVAPFARWWWLKKNIQVVHKSAYITGTVNVIQGSASITLSSSPSVGLGSFAGYRFSIAGSTQLYTVDTHVAGSASVVLTTAYQETTANASTYKIWRDRFNLPAEAKETIEVWHNQQGRPLDPVGQQAFREKEAFDPKPEGAPVCYSTSDYFDPSVGDDEFESDRFRQVQVYPSINTSNVILNVDYQQEVVELSDDADEPLMPIEDRICLLYGALAIAYSSLARDEDMHDRYESRFQRKLARMAGDKDEGRDNPVLSPSSKYINSIRRSRVSRPRSW